METFDGQVAVITGAASGIGLALAARAAAEGMKLVLADIEEAALAQAEAGLRADGAELLAVPTDVSQADQVAALAERALQAFGGVHLVCNNAGVSAAGDILDSSLSDWEWVLGVNLWGVIHGVRSFLPHMLAQAEPSHMVNTASVAGLMSAPGLGIYNVSKHGVVTLTETLYHELQRAGVAHVGLSVLCPGWVHTRIMEAARNRPARWPEEEQGEVPPRQQRQLERLRAVIDAGISPEAVAAAVFQAVAQNRFYILTHADSKPMVRQRLEDILQDRNPTRPGQKNP